MSRLGSHLKNGLFVVVILAALGGWGYVIYNEHRSHDPIEVIRKHFVFYPDYSHGIWRETPCSGVEKCRDVAYTVAIQNCGPETFHWRVVVGDDGDADWSYEGPTPRFDEKQYALYAILSEDSRLIDSPALGKPLPATCPSN